MTTDIKLTLRAKKLGIVLISARLASKKTLKQISEILGITSNMLNLYERGEHSPSLPELEILAAFYNIGVDKFIAEDISPDKADVSPGIEEYHGTLNIRQKIIGALIKERRLELKVSLNKISTVTGVPVSRIKIFERGDKPIPLPTLELIIGYLEIPLDQLKDRKSKFARWAAQQGYVNLFLGMPEEMQSFVVAPINLPYLELARRLSRLPAEKLRGIAEGLLEITL